MVDQPPNSTDVTPSREPARNAAQQRQARASATRHEALARAGHAAAFVCVTAEILVTISVLIQLGLGFAWLPLGALVLMMLLLILHVRTPSWLTAVAYLLAGAVATYLLTLLTFAAVPNETATETIAVALPIVAIVLVGGVGTIAATLLWSSAGFLLGLAATFLAAFVSSREAHLNVIAFMVLLAVLGAWSTVGLIRVANHRAVSQRSGAIRHSIRRERAYVAEVRALDQLTELALDYLDEIAMSSSGEPPKRLDARVNRDFGDLLGLDWRARYGAELGSRSTSATGSIDVVEGARSAEWARYSRAAAVASDLGLDLRVTGDIEALDRLERQRRDAADEAIAQCLMNVARHSGVVSADLVFGHGGGEVTIAVMDAGCGFTPAAVPRDRIGLRTSVIERIEVEGGTVRVWSEPGIGTTVVITLPERAA